jgi:PAS domain S-box-containing protein
MRPPPARASAEIIALYERVAAALSASADLADAQAAKGELAENAGGAGLAERARHAAERGRCIARRLCLRAQADRLFGDPPGWRALFDGHDELEGVLLRRLDEAVIATDLAGTVKLWNAAAERLYGWSCAEVVGRPITEITVGPDDAEVAEQIMASVRSIGSWEGEFWVTRHDGSRFLATCVTSSSQTTMASRSGWSGSPSISHPGSRILPRRRGPSVRERTSADSVAMRTLRLGQRQRRAGRWCRPAASWRAGARDRRRREWPASLLRRFKPLRGGSARSGSAESNSSPTIFWGLLAGFSTDSHRGWRAANRGLPTLDRLAPRSARGPVR